MLESGLSRRDLFKYLLATSALVLIPGVFKKTNEEVVGIALENFDIFLQNENLTDGFLKLAKKLLLSSSKRRAGEFLPHLIKDNPDFKPIIKMIEECINNYDHQIYYDPPNKILTTGRFIEFLESKKEDLSGEAQSITLDDVISFLNGENFINQDKYQRVHNFLSHAKDSIYMQDTVLGYGGDNYIDVSTLFYSDPNSGFSQRANGDANLFFTELNDAYNFLKQKFDETNKRVPSYILLKYFLTLNNGEIGKSIYDLAIFFKVLARNDLISLHYIGNDPDRHQELCDRFKMIEDEYSLVGSDFASGISEKTGSFDNTNKDLSEINQIGLPYHKWHTLAQLLIMDRLPVKVSVIGSQLFELDKSQGRVKTASDFDFLLELEEIEKMLIALIKKKTKV